MNSYDYKSTIINNDNSALKKQFDNSSGNDKNNWYREGNIPTKGYSVAVDNLLEREELNKNSNKMKEINAFSSLLEIDYENINNSKWDMYVKENGRYVYKNTPDYIVNNMNLGIIETPKISLGIENVMTNIRVINSTGQIIVDGNPAKQEIKYLSNLDSKKKHLTEGSDCAKIEINDNELYGAKLEITYAITIINNSDVNYYELKNPDGSNSQYHGYYYIFGNTDTDDSDEVHITIDKVDNYLDEKLTLVDNTHEIINKDTLTADFNQLKIYGGWKDLYTQKNTETSHETRDTAEFVVTRTLSNQDMNIDTNFENQVELTKMHVTNEPKLVEDINTHLDVQYKNYFSYKVDDISFENPTIVSSLTIIPPTGFDTFTPMIYIIATAIAGIIITIGIIVIKKKVI